MRNSFRNYSKYALGLLVFMFVFSLVCWIGDSGFHNVAQAKITQETIISDEEPIALDKTNPRIQAVMAVQNRHTKKLMAKPDVVGTATGLTEDNKPAIMVFTKKLLKAGVIPDSLEGIPVVVKVTGEIFALKKPGSSTGTKTTAWWPSPVPIGVSTGNIGECSAGTIGARVTDNKNVYALSNNHVYALENDAPLDSKILQPGLYDTRCKFRSTNIIGELSSYVPIIFNNTECDPDKNNTETCNTVDAAIAIVNTEYSPRELDNTTPPNGYGIPNSTTYSNSTDNSDHVPYYVGQAVQKYGRTTQLTKGTIKAINGTFTVCYDSSCSLNAKFIDQIVVGPGNFSKAGDSGSLVVTNDSYAYPIGLLFAGGGGITIVNPIDDVLSSFSSNACSSCEPVYGLTIDGK
jgi:hypothetical protein